MRIRDRHIMTLALVTVLMAMGSIAQAQSVKIAVFDPQRVSEETGAGKRAQSALQALRDGKQQQISDREKAINDLQQQFQQQGLSLSVDKRTDLELEIQRKLLALSNSKDLATRELQLEVAGAEARFNEKLRVVIEQLGNEENFELILDRATVAWASSAIDVTTAIIDRFDRTFPSGSD